MESETRAFSFSIDSHDVIRSDIRRYPGELLIDIN